jgi:diaminopimelate epimerase
VASVIAARVWGGADAPSAWTVDVPGGRLRVTLPDGDPLAGASAELAGPAVLGLSGSIDLV